MFHHFHDDMIHSRAQGSINKDDLNNIIKFIGKDNILDADIFLDKIKTKKIKNNNLCLTFDDGIKSQIDIALPVLEDHKIKSFFFISTSVFDGSPDYLEIFRYFRVNFFKNVDEFYNTFYQEIDKNLLFFFKDKNELIKSKKKKFPFYSIEDIKFRLVRDILLNKKEYQELMFSMFEKKNFDYEKISKKHHFNKNDLIKLDNLGHLIGLHSHSHPTLLEDYNYKEQKKEYTKCQSIISKILDKPKNQINSMSHPCGSYNEDTLKILKGLGIDLGFKCVMTVEKEKGMKKINNSFLEIARTDHTEILKKMKG